MSSSEERMTWKPGDLVWDAPEEGPPEKNATKARTGLALSIKRARLPLELKAKWKPGDHPRDRLGRFIHSDALLLLPGSRTGVFVGVDDNTGRVRVRGGDLRERTYARSQVEVSRPRPDLDPELAASTPKPAPKPAVRAAPKPASRAALQRDQLAFDAAKLAANPAKPAVKPEKPAANDPFSRGMKAFKDSGGTVEIKSARDAAAVRGEVDKLVATMGGKDSDFAKDDRVVYTYAAINEADGGDGGTRLLVARDEKLGIAGALVLNKRYEPGFDLDYYYIDWLGSTGITPGTGTALAVEAARIAQREGLPVFGQATPDSDPFWKKLGWHEDPTDDGVDLLGWNLEDLKKVVK